MISLTMIVSSALTIWRILMIITYSDSPIVVVLSGSMEPLYYRGDILTLYNREEKIYTGDVVVYKNGDQEIPIVHRVIAIQEKDGEDYYILTKGDNNLSDDRGLYQNRKIWLHKKDILGKIKGYCPYLGIVTIILNDYPMVKYVTLGLMGLFVLIAKDPQG
ncbi:sec11, putative [Ichthyophthirius multifiliis]|uniref:Signal peptidase complex catalytic subunit SEC11 n=1 Tax=Ichthyophthirius multifiliis TaxID=5932 RepID=G0QTW5_ICHMU|nr:sec11, putative [Ichthyophthirius multifiliis]EGR31324.1 sec11, putative [Ichthyophthirius multifiliis]|eukprot:XP_004034810.1 sec11, putative [Ichthyophthirius multifiliis]